MEEYDDKADTDQFGTVCDTCQCKMMTYYDKRGDHAAYCRNCHKIVAVMSLTSIVGVDTLLVRVMI